MRRRNVIFGVALVAVLAVPAIAYLVFLQEPAPAPALPAPPPEPPPPVVPVATSLRITEASGKVEVRRAAGTWAPATVGEPLERADSIRTADGSSAALTAEGRYVLRLEPASSFEVTELTTSVDRFLLAGGMATADVQAGRTIAIGAAGSDAVAETDGSAARFAISSNGAGTVAVGAATGQVKFSAASGVVVVKAGEQSIALPGAQPSAPAPAPSSLLLKVAWPSQGATNHPRLEVKGSTAPGALVAVGGKSVRVEADGRFATVVVLKEGENQVKVEAVEVGGKRASDPGARIRLDTRGAPAAFDTKGLWGDK